MDGIIILYTIYIYIYLYILFLQFLYSSMCPPARIKFDQAIYPCCHVDYALDGHIFSLQAGAQTCERLNRP